MNNTEFLSDANIFSNLVINLTDKCNLNCKYCFRDSGPNCKNSNSLDFKTVKNILSFFYKKNSTKRTLLQLTGGEALLHDDFFLIIECALSFNFVVRIQTNGTLIPSLSKEGINLLSNKHVITKISIDGWDKYIHGIFRDPSSYNSVIKGITTLRKNTSQVGLKSVIHSENFDNLQKMLDLCIDLDMKSWSHNILKKRGRSQKKGDISELEVTKKLITYYNTLKYRHLLGGSNVLMYYLLNYQKRNSFPNFFFVNSDGSIYINDNVQPDYFVGSVYEENLTNQFNIKNADIIPTREIQPEILEYVRSNLNLKH